VSLKADFSADVIGEDDRTLMWNFHADNVWRPFLQMCFHHLLSKTKALPVVHWRLLLCLLCFAHLFKALGRTETVVGMATSKELFRIFLVDWQSLRLVVRSVVPSLDDGATRIHHDAFIGANAHPCHARQKIFNRSRDRARTVCVLDAHDKRSLPPLSKEVVHQSSAEAPDVEHSRWRWRKAGAHAVRRIPDYTSAVPNPEPPPEWKEQPRDAKRDPTVALQNIIVDPILVAELQNSEQRDLAKKNTAILVAGFGRVPALEAENPVQAAFFRQCIAETSPGLERFADFAKKWQLRLDGDADLELFGFCSKYPEDASSIKEIEAEIQKMQAGGVLVKGAHFRNVFSSFQDDDKALIRSLRSMTGDDTFLQSLDTYSRLARNLDYMRLGVQANTAETGVVIYRILRSKNIRLEQLSEESANELRSLLQAVLLIDRPEWKGKFRFDAKNGDVGIVQEFTVAEAREFVQRFCGNVNGAERINAVLHPQVQDRMVNMNSVALPAEERDRRRNFPFRVREFFADPAIHHMLTATDHIPPARLRKDPEAGVIAGRNMWAKGLRADDVNLQTMKDTLEELDTLRVERANTIVLGEGRHVTVIANEESVYQYKARFVSLKELHNILEAEKLLHEGKEIEAVKSVLAEVKVIDRFAKESFLNAIKGSGSKLTSVIKPDSYLNLKELKLKDNYEEHLRKMQDQALQMIATEPPPHTFFFDGHGGANAFWLFQGQFGKEKAQSSKEPAALHYEKLAKALKERYENFKDQPEKLAKDVFWFSACFSNDLVRNVDRELTTTPYRPIFVAVAETGQPGYSDFNAPTGTRGLGRVLGLEDEHGVLRKKIPPVTIGVVMKRQRKGESNLSIFVPVRSGTQVILQQIADLQKPASKKIAEQRG